MSDHITDSIIAHTRNEVGRRQPLDEHLINVARRAREFADSFQAGELAHLAGLWHDIGKFHPDFQRYLYEAERNPERARHGPLHKAAGTCLAARDSSLSLLALPIAGHHGGLQAMQTKLRDFLAEHCGAPHVEEALFVAQRQPGPTTVNSTASIPAWLQDDPLQVEFFVRMLFSALVDADFLDTEQHFDSKRAEQRGELLHIEMLWREFAADQEARFPEPATLVHHVRDEVYHACLDAAEQTPGFFRLTVPTGGGKTRSGLAFALRHALKHELERVIVAIPYTSITEQTADEYRRVFSDPRAVLEHHSAVRGIEPEASVGPSWSRLAAENWDAPIIVTTTVQLFESLLGNMPSTCRKLHNIARSVILIDEVQTLPPGMLEPILDVLRELVAHYRVSVVLCTATQPALETRNRFPGLDGLREIVPDPARLFTRLRRVDYDYQLDAPWNWERVGQEMLTSSQALTIVNTRQDALALLAALDDPDALHLSTLLCGAHRREVLAEVHRRLRADEPCRLVSTQVVEAGVDLDFPLVLRALGPLDRIVQAAGRCNREGKLQTGRVVVFQPAEGSLPLGTYRTATEVSRHLLTAPECDLHEPAIYDEFFRRYYSLVDLDAKNVQTMREIFDYPEVAHRFRLIKEDSSPVVVRFPRSDPRRVDSLLAAFARTEGNPRGLWRAIQPFLVNIRNYRLNQYRQSGVVEEITPGLEVWRGRYDEQLGLVFAGPDPDDLIW